MAGCVSGAPATPPQPDPSGSAPISWDGDDDGHLHPEWGQPDPTTDPERSQATATALAGMTAFAQPDAQYRRWWADLAPYLTDAARLAYVHTDPANISASRVTDARVIPTDADTLARIQVRADDGDWTVMLTRTGERPDWKIDRMIPPPVGEDHRGLRKHLGLDDE